MNTHDRYGKKVTDAEYLQIIIRSAQSKIRNMREEDGNEYSEDGMKIIILDWLDKLYILPDDIDHVFSKLDF